MKESQLSFSYTWKDLKPIRLLALTVVVGQLLGAVAGIVVPRFPNWFESLWFGAALAAFPAFLIGALVQSIATPGRMSQHKVMVRRLAIVAAALSAFAFAMPSFGFGNAA
jgi:hypothetical protein